MRNSDDNANPTETKNWHVAKSASIIKNKTKWSLAKVKHFQIQDNGESPRVKLIIKLNYFIFYDWFQICPCT